VLIDVFSVSNLRVSTSASDCLERLLSEMTFVEWNVKFYSLV